MNHCILLTILGMAGYDPKKGRPHLTAWMDKVIEATSPYYQEAHIFLNEITEVKSRENSNSKL